MGSWRFVFVFVLAPGLGLAGYGCWAGNDCAVRATCSEADLDGAMTTSDGSVSDSFAKPDTFIVPDGPLPDGTCNGGAEDCANGMDDNCNTLVDCADPVCQGAGYSCTDAPPMGWSGPMAYWEAMSGTTAPACTGSYNGAAVDLMSGLSAGPAQCGCSCTGPGMESCGNASGQLFDGNGQCQSACSGGIGLPPMFCVSIGCAPGSGFTSALFPKFAAQNGQCNPNPMKSVPNAQWTNIARVCPFTLGMPAGGCTANKLCVTPPSSPFGGPCISSPGDQTCPVGYPNKHLQYGGVNDTRGCTNCACTYNPGQCGGSVIFYNQSACQGGVTGTLSLGQPCTAVANGGVGSMISNGNYFVSPAGSCTAGSVSPNGSATPSSPTTVCCK